MKAKKAAVVLLKILAWTLGAILVLLATTPLWLGPAVKVAANKAVPGITGTDFAMERAGINPFTGGVHVGGVCLSNPEGFSQRTAVSVGSLDVDLDVSSVLADTIQIRSIEIRDTFVSYVRHDGKFNFDVIAENAASGSEDGEKEAKEAKDGEEDGQEGGKKVVIDRLVLSGLKVEIMGITMTLPTIVLKDIGRDSGGATWLDALSEISKAIVSACGSAGEQLMKLGEGLKDLGGQGLSAATNALGNVGAAATNMLNAAGSIDLKGASETLKSAGATGESLLKGLKDTGKDSVDGAVSVIKDVGNVGGDALKGSFKALKGLGKDLKNQFKGK